MDAKELQYFCTVYEEKSLNRASGKLFITSQGLSRVIAKLENELNAKLFVRTQKGVVPTECAAFLYKSAQTILHQFNEMENGVRQLAQKSTHLRVACATGVFNALSFDMILSFMQNNPAIQMEWIECSNSEAKERVTNFEADAGFVIGGLADEGIFQKRLAKRKVAMMVHKTHPLYAHETLDLADLKNENIVTLNKDYRVNEDFRRKCEELGFLPKIVAETVDTNFLYKLCKLAVGVGILVDCSVDHCDMRDLKIIHFKQRFDWEIYLIIQLQNTRLPLIQAFLSHLAKCNIS